MNKKETAEYLGVTESWIDKLIESRILFYTSNPDGTSYIWPDSIEEYRIKLEASRKELAGIFARAEEEKENLIKSRARKLMQNE